MSSFTFSSSPRSQRSLRFNLGLLRSRLRPLRFYRGLLLSLVLLVNQLAIAAAPAVRPNVLLVFTDDQSFRTLSCYRAEGAWPWVSTPNIDRLAHEGVRFT